MPYKNPEDKRRREKERYRENAAKINETRRLKRLIANQLTDKRLLTDIKDCGLSIVSIEGLQRPQFIVWQKGKRITEKLVVE